MCKVMISAMKKTGIFLIIFFIAGISALAVMNGFHSRHIDTPAACLAEQGRDSYNQHLVDTAVSLLKSGYIVLRTGSGADSYMLAQMNQKDKTYSHCGIVMI